MDDRRVARHAEFLLSPEYSRALDGVCSEHYGIPEEVRTAMEAIGVKAAQERQQDESYEESLKIETGLFELYDPDFDNAFTREIRELQLPHRPAYSEAEPPKGSLGVIRTNELLLRAYSESTEINTGDPNREFMNLLEEGLGIIESRRQQQVSRKQNLISPGNVSTLALFVHRRMPKRFERTLNELDDDQITRLDELFERWMTQLEAATEVEDWNRIEIGNVVKFLPLVTKLGYDQRLAGMITEQLFLNTHNIDRATVNTVMAGLANTPEDVNLSRPFGLAFELLESREEVFEISSKAVDTVKALCRIPPEYIGKHVYHSVLDKLERYEEVFSTEDAQQLIHALQHIDNYPEHDDSLQLRLFDQAHELIMAIAADPEQADVGVIESLASKATLMRGYSKRTSRHK